ncbi:hypothetical protein GmRootV118_17660 [Variovorax sp. V118]
MSSPRLPLGRRDAGAVAGERAGRGVPDTTNWPGFAQVLARHAIHVAPMPGKNYQWCAVVVGRPGRRLPEGRGGWLEGPSPLVAVSRAIVSARYGSDVEGD